MIIVLGQYHIILPATAYTKNTNNSNMPTFESAGREKLHSTKKRMDMIN